MWIVNAVWISMLATDTDKGGLRRTLAIFHQSPPRAVALTASEASRLRRNRRAERATRRAERATWPAGRATRRARHRQRGSGGAAQRPGKFVGFYAC